MPDWSHQERLVIDARSAFAAGHRRILIALATGGGKTRVGSVLTGGHLAKDQSHKLLWIAHLRELLGQASQSLAKYGADMNRTIVESVQTLDERGIPEGITCVVVDEAHHAVNATYQRVLSRLSPKFLIGLTATPSRLDGVGLGNAYSVIVAGPQPRELVRSGVLVPTRVFAPQRSGRTLAMSPVDAIRERAPGRKSIVFASSVEHASKLAEELTLAGIPAASLDGKTRNRADINARFAAGELLALTTYRLITEGYDVPDCSCIVLAGNTTSPAMLLQMAGRGKRSSAGKTDELFLDLVGACETLDLHPDDDMVYSLEGDPIKVAGIAPDEKVRQCERCGFGARFPEFHDGACPACGHVRPGRKDPRVAKAELEERERQELAKRVDRLIRMGSKTVAFLADAWRDCDTKGHKRGAAMFRFKGTFYRFPNAAERAAAEKLLERAA